MCSDYNIYYKISGFMKLIHKIVLLLLHLTYRVFRQMDARIVFDIYFLELYVKKIYCKHINISKIKLNMYSALQF